MEGESDMYGKHYASMYEGSMRGAGSAFFAVWGWIISHMRPDRQHGTVVELNAELVAFVIGERVEVVEEVVAKMCAPDERSRSKTEEGRKLVRVGEYGYRVVNGAHYRAIRDEQDRRDYQANWQRVNRRMKKAIESGVEMDPNTLTPKEWKRYEMLKRQWRSRNRQGYCPTWKKGQEHGQKDVKSLCGETTEVGL